MIRFRTLAIGLLLLGLAPPAPACEQRLDCPVWTTEYDAQIRKYTKRYFGPSFDWRWFRAQAIAESSLRAHAVSPRGARGVLQLMPQTYSEMVDRNNWFPRIDDPRANIAAGIYWNRVLFDRWRGFTDSDEEALKLVFASYNAGHTRTRFAFRSARESRGRSPGWGDVKSYLPAETRTYVHRIYALMDSPLDGVARRALDAAGDAVAAEEGAQP
jgi:membrane-bound lytic murein transglycosylase MltF